MRQDDFPHPVSDPDQGNHRDLEKDEIALDADTAGGGASTEETALHEETPDGVDADRYT